MNVRYNTDKYRTVRKYDHLYKDGTYSWYPQKWVWWRLSWVDLTYYGFHRQDGARRYLNEISYMELMGI